ncbi:hypothetical protein I6B53_02910 [Schaalia sp. 19OD2882]|uniref:hypothetical protein n=1 Tax=Schaalia sp. 19OD2882 TaxID=2794089 RepID=UPI001C1EF7EA|nr:hypothetical protein [Schaalia sp. 19OD2882]QWW20066.1 hypothetical protein I6B53_02910 [Schaalia sp. 19OD2882]
MTEPRTPPAAPRRFPAAHMPVQTNPTTCGIASLAVVAARAGRDPDYLGAPLESVARRQALLHRLASRTGLPWPRALGTSPWALAALAERATGARHVILPWGAAAMAAVQRCVRAGQDVFLYSGDAGQWWSRLVPRHVVLVLGPESDEDAAHLSIYEPSTGHVHRVASSVLTEPDGTPVPALGHWRRVQLVVAPAA